MVDPAFDTALQNTNEIEITTIGRTTGRSIARPVWFAQRDDTLYLLPIKGSDSNWYRNLQKDASIRLAAGKAKLTSSATLITDPGKVEEVVEAFSAKYGAGDVKAYYPKTDVAVEVSIAASPGTPAAHTSP